jgi:hypothetical protein
MEAPTHLAFLCGNPASSPACTFGMAICAKQTFQKEYGTVRKTDPILHSCPSFGKHVNELYDAGTPCMFELLELRLRVVHGNMAIGRWLAWGCGLLGKHKKSGKYRE